MEDIEQLLADADKAARERSYAAAYSLYARAAAIDPRNYKAVRGKGVAMTWLNQFCFQASEVIEAAAALNGGQLDAQAIDAYYISLAYSGQAERAVTVLRQLLEISPYYEQKVMLAELTWKTGDLTACHIAADELLSDQKTWNPVRDGPDCPATLFPAPVLCTIIGEMANRLEMICKARALGWPVPKRLLLNTSGKVINKPFLNLWRDHFEFIEDPSIDHSTYKVFNTFVMRGADGKAYDRNVACSIIYREWKRRGLPPIIALSDDDRARGAAVLREMGIPEGAWYCGLHVRTSTFNDDGLENHNAVRNADITTYFPAIRRITEAGGWVLRMGDANMVPMPPMEGVIDYAVGSHKSPAMDAFLCATSAFFLATQSGMVCVAQAFGVPVVVTNILPNSIFLFNEDDVYIPRKLVSDRDGRVLPFSESYRPPYVNKEVKMVMDKLGIRPLAHTPEEIEGVIVEMIDRYFGRAVYSEADERLQQRFRRAVDYHGFGHMGRVGRQFLRDHLHYL